MTRQFRIPDSAFPLRAFMAEPALYAQRQGCLRGFSFRCHVLSPRKNDEKKYLRNKAI